MKNEQYEKPTLVLFGTFRELTQVKDGGTGDNIGADGRWEFISLSETEIACCSG